MSQTPESLVGAQSVRQLAEQLGISIATLVERASNGAPATAAASPAANRKSRAPAKDAAPKSRGKKAPKQAPKKRSKKAAASSGEGAAAVAHREAVVAVLKESAGEMRADEIAAKAKISLNSARAALNSAHALGQAKRTGNTRTTRWSAR